MTRCACLGCRWSHEIVLLLVALLMSGLLGCQLLFFLPALRDGKHYPQPVTWVEITRGQDVALCLQTWARTHIDPAANYADVDFEHHLHIVGVGDPGVAGPHDFVAARESGDTVYIDQRVVTENGAEYVALQRHEDVHVVQQQHHELIMNGNIHPAGPFDACRIPRYLIL